MPRACTVRGRAHARKLPGETSRQIARKRPTRAKRRGDRLRRSSVRQLDVFFAERFVDFRADDFVERFVDFRADDFVARFVDFRADDFVARFVDFRADFFAVLRPVFFADFFADFFGTLPPARRASDSPIAIACLRLFTFLPDLPLRNVPALRSCIAFSTLDCAFLPYFAIVSSCRNGADRVRPRYRAVAFRLQRACHGSTRHVAADERASSSVGRILQLPPQLALQDFAVTVPR
jgi:hypothetical protein